MTTAEAAAAHGRAERARSLAERMYMAESLICVDREAAIGECRAVALLLEELADEWAPPPARRRRDGESRAAGDRRDGDECDRLEGVAADAGDEGEGGEEKGVESGG